MHSSNHQQMQAWKPAAAQCMPVDAVVHLQKEASIAVNLIGTGMRDVNAGHPGPGNFKDEKKIHDKLVLPFGLNQGRFKTAIS